MRREIAALIILSTVSVAPVFLTYAQKQESIPRIGFLQAGAAPGTNLEMFLHGLRDLGYVEGKNIIIELRFAEGKQARLSELATKRVQLKCDAISLGGTRIIFAAKA